ncbi:MAG: hypothetical protein AB7S75_24540, partial [Desulfococcaceae bacterium]
EHPEEGGQDEPGQHHSVFIDGSAAICKKKLHNYCLPQGLYRLIEVLYRQRKDFSISKRI